MCYIDGDNDSVLYPESTWRTVITKRLEQASRFYTLDRRLEMDFGLKERYALRIHRYEDDDKNGWYNPYYVFDDEASAELKAKDLVNCHNNIEWICIDMIRQKSTVQENTKAVFIHKKEQMTVSTEGLTTAEEMYHQKYEQKP